MEINKKLLEEIKDTKEILSAMPKNNKKNAQVYLDELQRLQNKYQAMNDNIIEVLEKRHARFLNLEVNPSISVLKKQIAEEEYKVHLLNNLNTPFEKTNLDKILYDISKYYKGNFAKVNNDIFLAIRVFVKVGIALSQEDFIYSSYAKEYMSIFFEEINNLNSDKLRHTFEKIYWKEPNIINHIQLNFRYLYLKNIESFEKYIGSQEKSLNATNFKDILREYHDLMISLNELISNDSSLTLDKFLNGELEISDYDEAKIKDLFSKYICEVDHEVDYYGAIYKFNNTVKEYKKYFEYKFIVDDIKLIYESKAQDLASSKSKLKEINKLEQELEMASGKKSIFPFKKKFDVEKNRESLKNLYIELDEALFRELVISKINEDSKYIDLLKIAGSNFLYIARLYKKLDPDMTDEVIYDNFNGLREYLLSPYHNLINNLEVFTEYDIAMIISDKYKLDNLSISVEMLEKDNLDNLLKETGLLINYNNIEKLPTLSLKTISEFLKINQKLIRDTK